MEKIKFFSVKGSLLALVIFLMSSRATHSQVFPSPTSLADQLKAIGFTDVTVQAPTQNSFLPPVYYFHVKEALTGSQGIAWGQTANLVAAIIVPRVAGSEELEKADTTDIAGRTQLRVVTPRYYIVVTGPDKDKMTRLANNLKALF